MQDTKALLVLAEVLEQGSMNAAAKALGMTPSAVSQHVSRLEASHGLKLLHRSTRRLVPTDAGAALGVYCMQLRETLRQTEVALQSLKTEVVGELHLALTSGMADALAFQASLREMQREHPGLSPVLHFGDDLRDLHRGEIDIAIRGGERALAAPDLVARHLATWPWQICAAPQYLARHAPVDEPAQLLGHRWLHFQPIPVRMDLRRGSEHYPLEVPSSMACSQLMAVRALTLAGMGLSIQLAGEISALVREGRLVVVLPDWSLGEVSLHAVTPHRAQSAKVRAALGILQRCFAPGGAGEAGNGGA